MQELAHGCNFFIHLQESAHVFSPPSKSISASKATTSYLLLKSSIFKSALEVPETQALKKRVSNGSQTLASSTKTWICAFFSSLSSSSLCLFIYLFIIILTNQWFQIWKKEEPSEPQKPATVLRIVWSNYGLHGYLLFFFFFFPIKRFLKLKKSQNWEVWGFFGRTVRSGSGFKTLLRRWELEREKIWKSKIVEIKKEKEKEKKKMHYTRKREVSFQRKNKGRPLEVGVGFKFNLIYFYLFIYLFFFCSQIQNLLPISAFYLLDLDELKGLIQFCQV